jgi:hypothetical protein
MAGLCCVDLETLLFPFCLFSFLFTVCHATTTTTTVASHKNCK